jgi:hypothetical protein
MPQSRYDTNSFTYFKCYSKLSTSFSTTCQQTGNKQCEHILLTRCWNNLTACQRTRCVRTHFLYYNIHYTEGIIYNFINFFI